MITALEILSTFERYSGDSEFKIQMTRFSERMQRITKWAETLRWASSENRSAAAGWCCRL